MPADEETMTGLGIEETCWGPADLVVMSIVTWADAGRGSETVFAESVLLRSAECV